MKAHFLIEIRAINLEARARNTPYMALPLCAFTSLVCSFLAPTTALFAAHTAAELLFPAAISASRACFLRSHGSFREACRFHATSSPCLHYSTAGVEDSHLSASLASSASSAFATGPLFRRIAPPHVASYSFRRSALRPPPIPPARRVEQIGEAREEAREGERREEMIAGRA
ncbi:hypothetical protein CLOM_g17958 [Closterium sp. NIES-68]|nr:hypothetical protein CLOM_g17958 [Closterium sp. NIES-68]